MNKFNKITQCRISKSSHLISVLHLGMQVLTGVFPKTKDEIITQGPVEIVWCPDSGLLQLAHSYASDEMYGENYGYRSGLNQSMVRHLSRKAHRLSKQFNLQPGDVVLDIGSNDGTLLKSYEIAKLRRIGIDPTGKKFSAFYPSDILLMPDFFSAAAFRTLIKDKNSKIITFLFDNHLPNFTSAALLPPN